MDTLEARRIGLTKEPKPHKKQKKTEPARTFSVYVVELDKEVLSIPKFVKANPDHDPEKACFYVGMTGLDPEERFKNHKSGHKANRYVKKHGLWLRKKMFKKYNPMTREEAERKEAELAEELRRKGHAVWQH